jgi:SAM-dependent methyltransferase
MNYKISPQQAAGSAYQRALKDELSGGTVTLEDLGKIRINHPQILQYKAKVLGGRDEFKEYADWTDFLPRDFTPRRKCISLGSGLGRVEQYLVRRGFCPEIEAIELCADVNKEIRLKDERVAVHPGDLNFARLPANQYDFVICHGILHHLINLEYILDEINQALTPDGLLLVYEYVGETRWQFSQERKSFIAGHFKDVKFRFPPRWTVPSFESVRSGELLGLLDAVFGARAERSVSYGGVYFPFVLSTGPSQDKWLPEVIRLDAEVSAGGRLPPCYHMGVYRKTSVPAPRAVPWTDEELVSNLSPKTPLAFAVKERIKKTGAWAVARNVKRKLFLF